MARMRVIGSSFDKGYRDDLNYNFGLLEALIGEANGLTDNLREEMLEKVYNLQQQIDMLTGENIGELLERLNDSIQQALTAAQEARTAKTATEEATALTKTATELAKASALLAEEKANYANEKAVLAQEAADNANREASNLAQLKIDVVQATQDANKATGNAEQATQVAQSATDAINVVLPNVTGLVNLKEWNIETQYKKNNFVTLEGNGYMALRDNKGVKPPSFPVLSNSDWAMFVQKGEKGEQGTGVRILGTLQDEGSLPPTGEPGDAYLINGDLYVWSDTTDDWTNVGTIKGPKGDTGPQGPEGPQGPPGKDADLTEVNQQLAEMKPKVDNSWQKGVYSDATITNIGSTSIEVVYYIDTNDWHSTNTTEFWQVAFPFANFSGIIKVTYTSEWVNSKAVGGAIVVHNLRKSGNTMTYYEKNIQVISNDFAKLYFIRDIVHNDTAIAIPIFKAPDAKNPVSIKIEICGTTGSDMFQAVSQATHEIVDTGSATELGYPWTPQRASFVKATGDTMTGDLKINKGIPKITLIPTLSTPDATKYFELYYNAAGANNFGVTLDLDQKPVMQILGQKNIRFVGHDNDWFTIQDLKSSASDVKTNVAAAITEQGVPTSPTATGVQMATNIRAIPKGRKEASGIAYATNVSGRARLVVAGLSFNPTAIFITKENNSNTEFKAIYAPSDVFFGNSANAFMNFFTYNETGSIMIASPALVSNYQGFEMNVSMTYNSRSEGAYRWFAFG